MNNMNVRELIIHYLEGGASPSVDLRGMLLNELECHEYDGLCNIDKPCGCKIDDLAPCDNINMHSCVGGYEKGCNHPESEGWSMTTVEPKEKTDA